MKAQQLAEAIGARLVGNADIEIRSAKSIESATEDAMVLVEDAKLLRPALSSSAAAIVTGDFAATTQTSKTLLIAAQPKLAFVRASALLYPSPKTAPGVHSTAIV